METKQKIKQRRVEKLKRLQEEHARNTLRAPAPALQNQKLEREAPLPFRPLETEGPRALPSADGKWNDPEYLWKMQYGSGKKGPYPNVYEDDSKQSLLAPPSRAQLWVRLILSATLFAGVMAMSRMPYPWAQAGREYVKSALTEPMDMERLTVWYETKFRGVPSILPSFSRGTDDSVKVSSGAHRTYFAPAKGVVETPFSSGNQGVLIRTKEDAPVYAMDTGLVIFAGAKEGTGFTVIIRHPDGVQTEYGDIEQCKLEVNDWIKGGEAIGKAAKNSSDGSGSFYFAVQKEGRYVNPADVVTFVE